MSIITELNNNNNNGSLQPESEKAKKVVNQSNQSINQLYLNTVNGSASWFSDMPCDNYNL